MEQLLEKLMISKAIMDRHDGMKRGSSGSDTFVRNMPPELASYDAPDIKYNIPSEFMQEQSSPVQTKMVTKPAGVPSVDAIKNSKLPEEIKRLMIEHPIEQPKQSTPTLSNDLIEKASRLMKENKGGYVPESAKQTVQKTQSPQIDYSMIQKMIEEAVKKSLKENGLITESVEKSNEFFSFKVGKHIFEGKVTKIKKIS